MESVSFTKATCRDCGFEFKYVAEYFTARALQPPRRCRHCRAARRAVPRAVTVVAQFGTVERVGPTFAMLLGAEDGRRYFAHQEHIAPGDWPLYVGDLVSFEPSDTGFHHPHRHPRAYVVRREVQPSPPPG